MATAPDQATKPSGDWSQLIKDKVVFITGAGGGIGAVIVETCVLHGARVVVADANKTAANEVVKKIIDTDATRQEYRLCSISLQQFALLFQWLVHHIHQVLMLEDILVLLHQYR